MNNSDWKHNYDNNFGSMQTTSSSVDLFAAPSIWPFCWRNWKLQLRKYGDVIRTNLSITSLMWHWWSTVMDCEDCTIKKWAAVFSTFNEYTVCLSRTSRSELLMPVSYVKTHIRAWSYSFPYLVNKKLILI